MTALDVVILAAGKGTRMKSSLPKVLHAVGGLPMLVRVLRTAGRLNARQTIVVLGHGKERVQPCVESNGAIAVEQTAQLGTGHAVKQALPLLPCDEASTMVLFADVPLIRADTLAALRKSADSATLALLTTHLPDPKGYGRIVRDEAGDVCAIVEEKDASEAQRCIHEVNTGIMLIPNEFLHRALPALGNDNSQGEYYLTDLVGMARNKGLRIVAVSCNPDETQGVNDRAQLSEVERRFQRTQAADLMREGVTLADPARIDIRGEFHCGSDTEIDVNFVAEGRVVIGQRCRIGANVVLKDCEIADDAEIRAFSHIDGAYIGSRCIVGPYARLRPGADLAEGVHIGNFVEIKQASLGTGSKANHLAYIGDADIGSGVNVGAGTITCNYDGVNKSLTRIGDGAFIGSNSSLVAPVTVGTGATVGAGSVITEDVPDAQLAVARGKQRNIEGWQRPVKRK
jgi:bifunctional UDP-N-acetylglucosamine pyrophosphorylase/glucosamine-1-phosphate N-acetyltransferase